VKENVPIGRFGCYFWKLIKLAKAPKTVHLLLSNLDQTLIGRTKVAPGEWRKQKRDKGLQGAVFGLVADITESIKILLPPK
jgi:hypothetical protein